MQARSAGRSALHHRLRRSRITTRPCMRRPSRGISAPITPSCTVTAEDALDVIRRLPTHLRRTVRRLLADPDLSRQRDGAPRRDRRAVGRRWRRAVRRLQRATAWRDDLWTKLAALPLPLRRGAARSIQALPPAAWDAAARWPLALLPRRRRPASVGDKLHKFAAACCLRRVRHAMYRALVSHWSDPIDRCCRRRSSRSRLLEDDRVQDALSDPVERMMSDGSVDLSAGRHSGQGRPGGDGRESGNARAAARPSRRRVRLGRADAPEDTRRPEQVAAARKCSTAMSRRR